MSLLSHAAPFFLSAPSVCSSAPVSMKIQPLNQTALMVTWERPLTVYHPPITSYMVSYSWVKRDIADERTFTKTGDQSMASITVNCHESLIQSKECIYILMGENYEEKPTYGQNSFNASL